MYASDTDPEYGYFGALWVLVHEIPRDWSRGMSGE
jgi:hypothetical protein